MSNIITPNYTKHIGEVYFTLYGVLEAHLPIQDWKFLCEKRWFTDTPARDVVEAEFGLYNAREAKTSDELIACMHTCIEDYKEIMSADAEKQSRELIDSNTSTLLTMDEHGNLVVKDI